MRSVLSLGILGCLVVTATARGDDAPKVELAPIQDDGRADQPAGAGKAAAPPEPKTEEAKLLSAVRDALERNAQEIKALKEQYARDMEEQRKKVEAQQKQIETLEMSARSLQDQLQNGQGADRQQQVAGIQQKQMGVLEEQARLLAEQVEKQEPVVEKLQTQTATLESRAKQAAQRDRDLADARDTLLDSIDSQQRNPPRLPAPLKELFDNNMTNVTPLTIYSTLSTRNDIYASRRGAGAFAFEEFSPFFIYQLNKRILLSAETGFTLGGVGVAQAQIDIFLTNWLTADIGYFLTPIGFWSEDLNPRWINKLPDVPLVMNQVIPNGLATSGLQLRGSKYIARSPWKLEYSAYMTNGLGVPGQGQAAGWYDLGRLTGTTSEVNKATAYGGRLALRLPSRGINFGASEFVSVPTSKTSAALVSIWQPYFNYHRGNWDARFEYGQNYERTKPFIGNNINRTGLYAQLAYRDYRSLYKHLQRLEYVFRYSDSTFHGIDQAHLDLATFATPQSVPVNRNQYTIGLNYYLYATSILKFAYEINSETHRSLRDDVFMMQFVSNF